MKSRRNTDEKSLSRTGGGNMRYHSDFDRIIMEECKTGRTAGRTSDHGRRLVFVFWRADRSGGDLRPRGKPLCRIQWRTGRDTQITVLYLQDHIFPDRLGAGDHPAGGVWDGHSCVRKNRNGKDGRYNCGCVVYRICGNIGRTRIFLRIFGAVRRKGCHQRPPRCLHPVY